MNASGVYQSVFQSPQLLAVDDVSGFVQIESKTQKKMELFQFHQICSDA
jgi:hypothetical protein